jgi:uroporphyrin-3 C-methyltransferase
MTDSPPSALPPASAPRPASPPLTSVPPAAASAPPASSAARWSPGLVVAWALALAALLAAVLLWQRVSDMQRQLARQSADAGNRSVEARTLAQQAADVAHDNATQLGALQGRVSDLSAYRAQFDQLVQGMAHARDESLAAELDATLRMAQDQTQLTGSSEPLLAALGLAQRRLSKTSDPRLAPVASAVARDMERVKSASLPDTAGLLARIDQLLRQVDDLPAANGVGLARAERATAARTRSAGKTDRKASNPAKSAPSALARLRDAAGQWFQQSVWQPISAQVTGLVRVTRIDQPDALMMAPDQVFFVRENLKLRLQGARLAILAHQYEAARADLTAAQTGLDKWFDPAARRTQGAATLLQQIQGQTRAADLPRIDATLLALSSAQAAIDATGK